MTQTTRRINTWKCNRCGNKWSDDGGGDGNSHFIPWPGNTGKHLCASCAGLLDLWLMGVNTPAGIRFNSHEAARAQYARTGELHASTEFLRTTA